MLDSLLNFIEQVKQKGIELQYLNIGGGVGVCYENESIFAINDFIAMVSTKLKDANLNIILEPGRSIIANAGGLITKTILTKSSGKKEFVVVDAAMTELIRPTLYGAKHRVWQSQLFPKFGVKKVDIVGAVCECGDFLAQDCEIAVDKTSLFAIGSCGAYASTMGSNYNSRLKPCEIMIDGDKSIVIRKSEEYEDLIKNEIDFI
jgi:diaminopimelate decarboxylase